MQLRLKKAIGNYVQQKDPGTDVVLCITQGRASGLIPHTETSRQSIDIGVRHEARAYSRL